MPLYYQNDFEIIFYFYNFFQVNCSNTNLFSFTDDTVSFVIPLRGRVNQFIIGLGKSLAVLLWDGLGPDFELHVKESVDKDKHGNRFNDGKADPWGRLWAGKTIKY